MQPTAANTAPAGFRQALGLFDATMLVAGSMIGAGIFIVPAAISREVGASGWLLVVWLLTGFLTVCGALCYAELAAAMPRAGGQYVYLREAYGPLCGFLYGWTLFLVIQTGTIAAVAVSFAKFLGVLIPPFGTQGNQGAWVMSELHFAFLGEHTLSITAGHCVAVTVVGVLTWWNCRGVREGKWVQNVFTVTKALALLLLILIGLTLAADARAIQVNWQHPWAGITTTPSFREIQSLVGSDKLAVSMIVGGAMVGALFAADAWNNVTFTASEIRDPRRNLPRSMILGTGAVILLYCLANVAYLSALPLDGTPSGTTPFERGIAHAQDDRVATAVLERIAPGVGPALMAGAILLSTFGCVNGLILMGARLYYAMAQDGLFFQSIGQLNSRGVPAVGLWVQGAWASLLIFSGTYSDLLDYIIFAALLFYALTVSGLIVLRWRRPNAERPYRVAGYPFLPLVYVLGCASIMLDLLIVKPKYTWPGFIIVLTGVPVYCWWHRRANPGVGLESAETLPTEGV